MPSAATLRHGPERNYTITYVNGTLTVNPAALTITANNASKTYGQTAIFAGTAFTDQRPGQRRHGRRRDRDQHGRGGDGDGGRLDLPIVPSAATFGTGLGNYTITYVNGTLTVNPAALTITANNASKTYGQTVTLRRHGVHDNRPGQRRHGHRRDRDQHGCGGDGDGGGSPYAIVPSAARRRRV